MVSNFTMKYVIQVKHRNANFIVLLCDSFIVRLELYLTLSIREMTIPSAYFTS